MVAVNHIYGWAGVLVCILALFARSPRLEWASLILLAFWGLSNVVYNQIRAPDNALANIVVDALCFGGLWIALRGPHPGLLVAFAVIWVALMPWHLGWYLVRPPRWYWYDFGYNVSSVLQYLALGFVCLKSMSPLRAGA